MGAGRSLAVALLALLAAGACAHEAGNHETKTALPSARVSVMTVELAQEGSTEEVMGTVRSRHTAQIAAKVSGRIASLDAVPGQEVEAGQVLARLEAGELGAELDRALALSEQADRDFKRFSALLEGEAVTRSEFEQVESRRRAAHAAVEQARAMVAYATVRAPFSGVVTRKLVEAGELATPGRPLLEIEDPAVLRFEVDVPETLLAAVALGQRYSVTFDRLDSAVSGLVAEISPAADAASRTSRVKLDLDPAPGLRSGMFGRVALGSGRRSLLRVPAAAVVKRGQLELVYVAGADNLASMRLIRIGTVAGNGIEVLAGLAAGERVVVEGADGLADGQPLDIVD